MTKTASYMRSVLISIQTTQNRNRPVQENLSAVPVCFFVFYKNTYYLAGEAAVPFLASFFVFLLVFLFLSVFLFVFLSVF